MNKKRTRKYSIVDKENVSSLDNETSKKSDFQNQEIANFAHAIKNIMQNNSSQYKFGTVKTIQELEDDENNVVHDNNTIKKNDDSNVSITENIQGVDTEYTIEESSGEEEEESQISNHKPNLENLIQFF